MLFGKHICCDLLLKHSSCDLADHTNPDRPAVRWRCDEQRQHPILGDNETRARVSVSVGAPMPSFATSCHGSLLEYSNVRLRGCRAAGPTGSFGPKAPRRSEAGSCPSLWVEVVTGAKCILSNLTHAGEQRKIHEHSVRLASQPVFRLGGVRFTELHLCVAGELRGSGVGLLDGCFVLIFLGSRYPVRSLKSASLCLASLKFTDVRHKPNPAPATKITELPKGPADAGPLAFWASPTSADSALSRTTTA